MQLPIFEDKSGPGHQDDGQHEDPGQALTQAPLEVQRGYVALHLSNMGAVTIELYLISFMNFVGFDKYLIHHVAKVCLNAVCKEKLIRRIHGPRPNVKWGGGIMTVFHLGFCGR